MAKSVHNPEKRSRYTLQKDIDKILPKIENPHKLVMFISPSIIQDPEVYNKGRQLGYFSETIPNISRMIGTDDQEYEVEYPTLDDSELTLQKGALTFQSDEKPELFKFLMRHNRRVENNIRDENGKAPNPSKYKPIFKLHDPDKDLEIIAEAAMTEYNAMKAIYGCKDTNVITAFARALNCKTDQEFRFILHDVVLKVKKDPTLIKLMESKETKIKAIVSEAFQLDIIKQDKPGGTQIGWVEGDDFQYICTLPIGQKADVFFTNWLMNDVSDVLENIQTRINMKRKPKK